MTSPAGPRPLGLLGTVGPLALGTWRSTGADPRRLQALLEAALEMGITLLDTADVYGVDTGSGFGAAEAMLGRVFRESPGLRDNLVLATKGGIVPPVPYDSSHAHLTRALDASLERLAVDVVDLYQVHRPDLFVHPEELAATLSGFVETGKVKAIGVSNHTVEQVEALAAHLDVALVSHQPEFSLADLSPIRDGRLDQCMRLDLTPLAWSPLAGGRLATGEGIRTELMVAIDRIAAVHGVDRTAVALAFVLHHPSRPIPILGTQDPDRLRMAMTATELKLEREELYRLVQASEGAKLP